MPHVQASEMSTGKTNSFINYYNCYLEGVSKQCKTTQFYTMDSRVSSNYAHNTNKPSTPEKEVDR